MAPAVELLILMELQVGEEEVVSVVAEEEVFPIHRHLDQIYLT